jgi:transcriptional regulator with XRE-family HTH domain
MLRIVLKDLRESMGLSQRELGEKLGLTQPAVAAWESGRNKPDPDMIVKLANVFGVPVSTFFDPEDSNSEEVLRQLYAKALARLGILLPDGSVDREGLDVLIELRKVANLMRRQGEKPVQ